LQSKPPANYPSAGGSLRLQREAEWYTTKAEVRPMEDVRSLFYLINRRFSALDKHSIRQCDAELSLVQSHILYEIDVHYNPSMQQIADALSLDITTFSRQIQSLVKLGLVHKTTLPEDRRVTILSLTTQGKETVSIINQQMNVYLHDIFSQMTSFEQDTVIRSIKLLHASMVKSDSSDTTSK
jgi:DNA-binding MarR family transcriptional regulator